jgi:hypothetical protein
MYEHRVQLYQAFLIISGLRHSLELVTILVLTLVCTLIDAMEKGTTEKETTRDYLKPVLLLTDKILFSLFGGAKRKRLYTVMSLGGGGGEGSGTSQKTSP